MYDDTIIINDDLRSHRVLLLDNHLSKLSSEQKAEAAKKIVVNILPVDSTGTQQPCDEGRVDFHRMKLALKADAQNQWLGFASHTNHVDERHYKSWRTKAKQAN